MLLSLENFEKQVTSSPKLKLGCIVDTNVLFAATVPQDAHNEWAEKVITLLHKLEIPLYTNLNVRSEFMELNRRVLIPEGLIDFSNDVPFDGRIAGLLKQLRRKIVDAQIENKTFKLSDKEIKNWRGLLKAIPEEDGSNVWTSFCRDYFAPYLRIVWDDAVKLLKLNFLGTREIESKRFFVKYPQWQNMVEIVGRTGIGTADAMIINLFLESKLPFIITVDRDVKETVLDLMTDEKFILSLNI